MPARCILVIAAALAAAQTATAQTADSVEAIKQAAARQGLTLTDEQARQLALKQFELQMRFQGAMGAAMGGGIPLGAAMAGPQGIGAPPAAAMPAATETEASLAAKLGASAPAPRRVPVALARDGLLIDGRPLLDPEGRIVSHDVDHATGRIGYLVRRADGTGVARLANVAGTAPPVTIATLVPAAPMGGEGFTVGTVTGARMAGNLVLASPDGLIAAREGALFRYVAGRGVQSHALPDGWSLAETQAGAVGSTETVLLERTESREALRSGNAARGLLSGIRSLGATIGVGRKQDFALYHLPSGRLTPLDIASDDKDVQRGDNCRRVNPLVNRCERVTSYESIFKPDGSPNGGHYHWRADWFQTPDGPYAVVMEKGSTQINAIDLRTGARLPLRSRGLGLGAMRTVHQTDGRVSIEITRGFVSERIDDVAAAIREAAARPAAQVAAE